MKRVFLSFVAAMAAVFCSAPAVADPDAAAETEADADGGSPSFSLPVECPAAGCLVQNYVDRDDGDGVLDFQCGGAAYDGHKGVDFRLLSAAQADATDAPVLAAAPGRVVAVRDGERDRLARTADDFAAVKGRECGNGVVVDHGGGWVTQYCHLKKGSLAVRRGDVVESGARLGAIGYSGRAAFAHVHFEIRRKDAVVDPFMPARGGCDPSGAAADLWTQGARTQIPAATGGPMTAALEAGFAPGPVSPDALEDAGPPAAPATPQAPALVFYARFMNTRGGDEIRLDVQGPDGPFAEATTGPLERNKATYVAYAGARRRDDPWARGRYEGRAVLVRGDHTVAEATAAIVID
ncbi:MAG: M23 family metallopeptidase [Pseudomonadota bacterium]